MAIKISEISKIVVVNPELSVGTSCMLSADTTKTKNADPAKIQSEDKHVFEKMVRLEANGLQTVFDQYKVTETEDAEWMAVDRDETETELKKKEEQAYLQKYASFELLGHTLGYQLKHLDLAQNPTISVLEEDGSSAEYFVHRLAVSGDVEKGLMAHVLIPKNTKPGNQDIKIVFQGSCNRNGAARDAFENGGAGTDSFQANRDSLLLQINGLIKNFKQRMNAKETLSVTIAGHSLGGSDAQNCMASMMDAAAQNCGLLPAASMPPIPKECRDALQTISKLRLATQNSAGITTATAKRADLVAGYIAEQRGKFKKNPTKGINLELESYNLHVAADGVQQTGEAHILSDVSSKLAKVDVMKVQSAWENKQFLSGGQALLTVGAGTAIGATGKVIASAVVGGAVGAAVVAGVAAVGVVGTAINHTSKFFHKPVEAQYERMNNSTRKGQKKIKKHLGNKSSWLNGFQNAVLSFSSAVKGIFGSKNEAKDEKPVQTICVEVQIQQRAQLKDAISAIEASGKEAPSKDASSTAATKAKPVTEKRSSSWFPFWRKTEQEQETGAAQIKAKTESVIPSVSIAKSDTAAAALKCR